MKNAIVVAIGVVSCSMGCERSPVPIEKIDRRSNAAVVRNVTFRSHLTGSLEEDATIDAGETVRVTPDPAEPTLSHESILVRLPKQTPYQGSDELYYLRGYAIGQLSAHNSQFS